MARTEKTKATTNDLSSCLSTIASQVKSRVEQYSRPRFVPTGVGERIIQAIGRPFTEGHKMKIINVQGPNKNGKTTSMIAGLANIIWEPQKTYFNFGLYKNFNIINSETGEQIKRIRIISTAKHLVDSGSIPEEINKWWPRSRYTVSRAGQDWNSIYKSDSGWTVEALTFDQKSLSFEGQMGCITVIDEPLYTTHLMGAIMSRLMFGGMLILTQTPIGAGPMLSVISDIVEAWPKEYRDLDYIEPLKGITMYDNDREKGIPNSLNERRGLMTTDEINTYALGIPEDEKPARLYGLCQERDGLIYSNFDKAVHVNHNITLEDPAFRSADCFCIVDPHEKRFPAIQWWALMPQNENGVRLKILYNEWPNYGTFSNNYYDTCTNKVFHGDYMELANIIKAYDMTSFGYHVVYRTLDPRFMGSPGIRQQMALAGLDFSELPRESIKTGRDMIQHDLSCYNQSQPINVFNQPNFYIMPHCKNSIRAFARHHWIETKTGKDKEGEKYKDFIDCARMFYVSLESSGWKSWKDKQKQNKLKSDLLIVDNIENEFRKVYKNARL